jgi:hypothetical protein
VLLRQATSSRHTPRPDRAPIFRGNDGGRWGAALTKVVQREELTLSEFANAWRGLITADHDVGRAYALHLIERIELHDEKAVIFGKQDGGAVM